MLQDRGPLDAAGGRQDHAGQPPAVWPAVPARRLWALRSARCRVTEGPAARCESTRSRSMRARLCARRLTRPSSMTMRSASAIAELLTRGSASVVGRRSAQRGPGPPGVRAERLAPGRGASSAGGTRHGSVGPARNPRRVGRASPGLARHERGIARSSQGPCASPVTPSPGTPMPAYGRWYATTGIIWSSSGRTRPVPVAPSVGPARCVTRWSSLANY